MFDDGTETYIEIPSDRVPFEQRPWMKAAEITDRLIAELRTGKHQFARVNYANGDMVGHTGAFDATVLAVEAVDLQLARLREGGRGAQGILVVTADHGNADEMFQRDKKGKVMRDEARPAGREDQPHAHRPCHSSSTIRCAATATRSTQQRAPRRWDRERHRDLSSSCSALSPG